MDSVRSAPPRPPSRRLVVRNKTRGLARLIGPPHGTVSEERFRRWKDTPLAAPGPIGWRNLIQHSPIGSHHGSLEDGAQLRLNVVLAWHGGSNPDAHRAL